MTLLPHTRIHGVRSPQTYLIGDLEERAMDAAFSADAGLGFLQRK